jgi:hypothetical protein
MNLQRALFSQKRFPKQMTATAPAQLAQPEAQQGPTIHTHGLRPRTKEVDYTEEPDNDDYTEVEDTEPDDDNYAEPDDEDEDEDNDDDGDGDDVI